jgi:hypothetical protein
MFRLKKNHAFFEQCVGRQFTSGQDRQHSPIYIYYEPYGGFFKKYYLGSYRSNDPTKKGLAWQRPYLENLIRTVYWLLNPWLSLLSSICISIVWNWFFPVENIPLLIVLVCCSIWISCIPLFLIGNFIFTRGLRVEKIKPISKEAKTFLKEKAGMTDEQIDRAQLYGKRNFPLFLKKYYRSSSDIHPAKIAIIFLISMFGFYQSILVEKNILLLVSSIFLSMLGIGLFAITLIKKKDRI